MKCLWIVTGIMLVVLAGGCTEPRAATTAPTEQPLVASGGAGALEKFSFAELVGEADRVVVSIVVSADGAWNADRTSVFATVRVRVAEVAKGITADNVTFVVEGGQVGDIAQSSEQGLSFVEGEHVVIFLRGESVVGGPQGVYRVVDGKVGEQSLEDFLEQVRAAQ